jgi:hypothetical protein
VPAPERNLLDLVPVRLRQHAEEPDGIVSILEERFQWRWMRRLFPRAAARPIRIRLDDVGAFSWLRMDGTRRVGEIAALLEERFGDRAHPAVERLARFVALLRRHRFIRLDEPR